MGGAGGRCGARTSFSEFVQGLFEYVSRSIGVAFNVTLYSFTYNVVQFSPRIIAICTEIPVLTSEKTDYSTILLNMIYTRYGRILTYMDFPR